METPTVTPIEKPKRSTVGGIYAGYLFIWLAAIAIWAWVTDSWNEPLGPWSIGILIGKSVAFWCVYGVYRFLTRNEPATTLIFCGDCSLLTAMVLQLDKGGYLFQCPRCGAQNVAAGKQGRTS